MYISLTFSGCNCTLLLLVLVRFFFLLTVTHVYIITCLYVSEMKLYYFKVNI